MIDDFMNYQEEETYLQSLSDRLDNDIHGRSWSKYRGDLINRTIIALLKAHIGNYKISEPNAFIEGYPTEFDMLVLSENAMPIERYSNSYKRADVKLIIEVKKSGFFYKKVEGIIQIGKYFETPLQRGIPFFYITIKESERFIKITRGKIGYRSFFLGTSHKSWNNGEWKNFVNAVKKTLNITDLL